LDGFRDTRLKKEVVTIAASVKMNGEGSTELEYIHQAPSTLDLPKAAKA
jgi:hypothetical protein